MKKFLLQLLLLASIVLVISTSIDYAFTRVFQTGNTYKNQWLDGIHHVNYDIAVLGSSKAWWNIDMNQFNADLNKNCINLASNHYSYGEMLLRLKRFYDNGNTVNQLLIQTEYSTFFSQDTALSLTVYDHLPYLDDSTTYDFLSKRSNEWIKLKYVPLWRYSEYNRQWGVEEFFITLAGKRNPIFDSTGTFFSNNNFYGEDSVTISPPDSFHVNPDFIALQEFCQSKNIEVQWFTAPVYHCQYNLASQLLMEQELDRLQLNYVNYIDLYNDSTFFNDNHHLSIKGGKAFTTKLIELSEGSLE